MEGRRLSSAPPLDGTSARGLLAGRVSVRYSLNTSNDSNSHTPLLSLPECVSGPDRKSVV